MRRIGYLLEKVVSFENLGRAAHKAFRGKKKLAGPAEFYFHLETELLRLQEEISSGSYRMQPYYTFEIHDPKRRKICAAGFRDRVVHHAICNVLDPVLDGSLIEDTFACRKGKGSHAAVRRAQKLSGRFSFFLKCDVSKFFDSVDHAILKKLLRRKIKDKAIITLLDGILDHPIPGGIPGKGLPIGNLTSQYFANFYMGELDHFLKERLGVKGYVRYMDDFLVFADNKATLNEILNQLKTVLEAGLALELKASAQILAPVGEGIPFLGFRIFPHIIRLGHGKWGRFRRKVADLENAYKDGWMSEEALSNSVNSMIGHIRHGDTLAARRTFFEKSLDLG